MKGWHGKILWIDVGKKEAREWSYPKEWALNYLGGRGLAARILWEFLPPGVDPLSPDNLLIFAVGPLTGLSLPSSGKMIVAGKSPLTGGYGDGNVGTWAAVHLRQAGFDAVVFTGASQKPVTVYIENDRVEFHDADDLWGLDTWETERRLREKFGKDAGIVEIGPAGENLVRYATVISQEGRSGGRPGMGALMGSKKIKAVVIRGDRGFNLHDPKAVKELGSKAYQDVVKSKNYRFWMRQGTMMTVEWAQEASVLPAYNFREGVFDEYSEIGGFKMEQLKIGQRGCPKCNMVCGNMIKDAEDEVSELDYENVAMLGSNIGLGDLRKVAVLNKLADKLGLDTISLGSSLAWAAEATERKHYDAGVEWGDYERFKELISEIAYGETETGRLLGLGVKKACEKVGGDSCVYAMHSKGLEVSAYDCHAAPGMALAYGTSPIGAHHKDAWLISWEVATDRFSYGREKAEKLIELQNIRGGLFESFVACRFPWVEVGLDLDYYPKLLTAATGVTWDWKQLNTLANRVYTLVRALWIREYGGWSRDMDMPPARWFKEPLTKGPLAGSKLDVDKYNTLLDFYYELRGWDRRGVPKKSTLEKLGLGYTVEALEKAVGGLTP